MRTVLVPILGAALLAVAAVACSRGNASADGRITVVAAFFPLVEAAGRVGGTRGAVTNLTAPGVEPHDIELTPDQLRSIATADLVLYLGGGFQPAVQDAVGDASGSVVDVSQGLRSLPVPPGESAEELAADPHVWLDPVLYGQIVDRVAQALSTVDPSHASTYRANAAGFDQQVDGVDEAYRTGLAHCEQRVIVTSHARRCRLVLHIICLTYCDPHVGSRNVQLCCRQICAIPRDHFPLHWHAVIQKAHAQVRFVLRDIDQPQSIRRCRSQFDGIRLGVPVNQQNKTERDVLPRTEYKNAVVLRIIFFARLQNDEWTVQPVQQLYVIMPMGVVNEGSRSWRCHSRNE